MFGTKWAVYHTSSGNQLVALPVNTPKLPKGMKGNVDTVAGMRLIVNHATSSRHASPPQRPVARPRGLGPYDGGTPTRTGTVGAVVRRHDLPRCARLLQGPVPEPDPDGLRDRAAAGRGPARPGRPARDRRRGADAVLGREQFRNCFGAQGTSLKIHNGSGIKPILESSLDAMVGLDGGAAARPASTSGSTRSARTTTTATCSAS